MSNPIHVIVADNDRPLSLPNQDEPFIDDGGPIVFEQYVKTSSLEDVQAQVARMAGRYGRCRIARLEFLDDEEPGE